MTYSPCNFFSSLEKAASPGNTHSCVHIVSWVYHGWEEIILKPFTPLNLNGEHFVNDCWTSGDYLFSLLGFAVKIQIFQERKYFESIYNLWLGFPLLEQGLQQGVADLQNHQISQGKKLASTSPWERIFICLSVMFWNAASCSTLWLGTDRSGRWRGCSPGGGVPGPSRKPPVPFTTIPKHYCWEPPYNQMYPIKTLPSLHSLLLF